MGFEIIQPAINSLEYALPGSLHAWHYKPFRAYGFERVKQCLRRGSRVADVLITDDMSEMTVSSICILSVVDTSGRHWNRKERKQGRLTAYLNVSTPTSTARQKGRKLTVRSGQGFPPHSAKMDLEPHFKFCHHSYVHTDKGVYTSS
jgi:hypothetical protein